MINNYNYNENYMEIDDVKLVYLTEVNNLRNIMILNRMSKSSLICRVERFGLLC